jgi:Phage terminase large subunit (GpA)
MTMLAPSTTLSMHCSPKFATRRRPERPTFGGELAAIAAKLGQPFMPWQRDAAEVGCEIDPETGRPAYRKVVITVPRQQGKTTLFLTWQLDRCLSPRWAQPQRSAFTAQSGKDARDKWLDELFPLIRRSRKIMPLVGRIYEGMGNEYIRFRNGSLIRLLSTSTSSGHSKTLHQAVLDEIWHDADSRREQGLGPAMLTIADAQLLFCSTAGNDASVILDRYVKLGRAAVGEDSGHGIAYIEYSAPDGWDPADEESYYGFMPALCPDPPCRCGGGKWRHTVTMDAIRSERVSMEPAEFARAYGNIPDRSGAAALWTVISEPAWADLADPESHPVPRVVLSAVFAHDQSAASVGLAGWRPDGLLHVEVADYRPGTAWAVPRLIDINARHDPLGVVVDEAGHESAIIKDLEAAGVPVIKVGTRGVTQAYAEFTEDAADSKRLRHRNQADLNDALAVAVPRDVGDGGQAWGRRKSAGDISPVVSVTNAAWGLRAKTAEGGGDPGAWLI